MEVQIVFKRTGSNSVYGSFEAGDVMRCSQELAEHFVKEGLAVYTGNTFAYKSEVQPATVDEKPAAPKKPKGKAK